MVPDSKSDGAGSTSSSGQQASKSIGKSVIGGFATKGKYVPLDLQLSDSVWGIVHLYREATPSPSLYTSATDEDDDPSYLKGDALSRHHGLAGGSGGGENGLKKQYGSADVVGEDVGPVATDDCSILCILAVPSYLGPSDFLGFVGEQTHEWVSHFRMIRTARANRYMVLMKFRSARRAKEWQKDWNGKVFNSMEPETCHVVFVRTIDIRHSDRPDAERKFPDTNADPFNQTAQGQSAGSLSSSSGLSSKPLAPPTPALVELPTCPVCLERMDETSGLLTIICQHVFHCTCLQKWKGSGCPVCRYSQADFSRRGPFSGGADGSSLSAPPECSVCHSEVNLWVCLICGNVGCGRYDEAHAFAHYKETHHSFAMDIDSQRVWDYVGDGYVHRIIQNKPDGSKLVELPSTTATGTSRGDENSALGPPDWADAVPREKFENMSLEYTHLLTSQLDSQRAYFEAKVERAADKAAEASIAATTAAATASAAAERFSTLQTAYDTLMNETLPALERDRDRMRGRAERAEALARRLEKEWREEKAMGAGLAERVSHLSASVDQLSKEKADLMDTNRDLSFFISGSERLKAEADDDIVEGTVSVPDPPQTGRERRRRSKR